MMTIKTVYPLYLNGIKTREDVHVFDAHVTDEEYEFILEVAGGTMPRFHTNKYMRCIASSVTGQLESFLERPIKRTFVADMEALEVHGGQE